jgi:RNA polymerase sigma-70 factor, ECF subfamily
VYFPDEVAHGVRSGDPDAVGQVYVHLADRLLSYLVAQVGDRATAEDLLEATFIELLRKGHTIRGGPAAMKVWLFRAAHYNVLDHVRRTRRRCEDLVDDIAVLDVQDPTPGPADRAEAAEVVQRVRSAMRRLSTDQQRVLVLRYVSGLSAPEVAEVLGKTDGAVRSLQHRGERSLARILGDDPTVSVPTQPASQDHQ